MVNMAIKVGTIKKRDSMDLKRSTGITGFSEKRVVNYFCFR
jgi:hypothetical protein